MFWIPLAVFAVHMAEELPRFPAWVTRHFGATSLPWYVYSHIALVAIGVAVGAWAGSAPPGSPGIGAGLALMWTLLLNGVFHLVTTIRFREYSPGVVTGLILFVPATVYIVVRVVDDGLLDLSGMLLAGTIGTVVQVLVIASLWLPMDIDWRFRRRASPRAVPR